MDVIRLDATETIHYCWVYIPREESRGVVGFRSTYQYLIRGRLLDKIEQAEDGSMYAWDTNVGEVVRIVVND